MVQKQPIRSVTRAFKPLTRGEGLKKKTDKADILSLLYVYWGMHKINEITKEKGRIDAKYVHITLHKLKNEDKAYWVEKARTFRANVVAVLVGLEENHEEGKGVHAHIFIQFSTYQKLSRKQFVDHFGTDSLHISTRKSKDDLIQGLGYVSKTGNTAQHGVFTYRGVELDANPEVHRFNYEVKNVRDALRYFAKVIKENFGKDQDIIKTLMDRDDDIGRWLQQHRQHATTLHKLAYRWGLRHANEQKQGFTFKSFMDDDAALARAYEAYLKEFPEIFKKNLPKRSKLILEEDYADHKDNDLEVLRALSIHLKEALDKGYDRPLKSLNVYLWSRNPSFGKTRLLNFLDDHMMTYRLPDDQYYVDYKNKIYQVLVSDEADAFIKTKDYSHLKHIFEGQRVEFNRKGKEKVYKEDNPLLILADNVSFDTLMKKRHPTRYSHEVMKTRVESLELKSRATLHFLIDRCIEVPAEKLPLMREMGQ